MVPLTTQCIYFYWWCMSTWQDTSHDTFQMVRRVCVKERTEINSLIHFHLRPDSYDPKTYPKKYFCINIIHFNIWRRPVSQLHLCSVSTKQCKDSGSCDESNWTRTFLSRTQWGPIQDGGLKSVYMSMVTEERETTCCCSMVLNTDNTMWWE